MTHPNFAGGLQNTELDARGGLVFVHRVEDVDKEVRAAYFTFLRGLLIWARYFCTEGDFDRLGERLENLIDRFNTASRMIGRAED